MSDFIYSAHPRQAGELDAAFRLISKSAAESVQHFHGAWGSLAVSHSPYHGYEPYEDETHICIVLGGPVLYFRDNAFFAGNAAGEGTKSILQHWRQAGTRWDEDLSGPFAVLILDKRRRDLRLITDLMLFIPIFSYGAGEDFAVASHVDMLAAICGQRRAFDPVSLADFVLHGCVTYPYTAYRGITQVRPASEHHWCRETGLQASPYWEPREVRPFAGINDAAAYLRDGFTDFIERVTASMDHIAQFISGGEDSRALSGALPARLRRDAYIFLDGMNREGRIAAKVARAYGADFRPDFRSATHYLDILPNAAALVGSGHQYRHGHILGFHEKHKLYNYPAVFGGYYSDTLLKALGARLSPLSDRFDFLPQKVLPGETRSQPISHPLFSEELTAEITRRARAHLAWIAELRPVDQQEWFSLWPSTMRPSITNIHFNRRLCASFEPFLCKEAVKVSAAVPVEWKLNRRLFLRTFRPFLSKTRLHRHADGRFPYLPWWLNSPIRFSAWLSRAVTRRLTKDTSNQGPWCNWGAMARSAEYAAALEALTNGCQNGEVADLLRPCAASPEKLTAIQKVNLMQTCYLIAATDDDDGKPQPALATSADLELNV